MIVVFDRDHIVPELPGIVLLSHGPFAGACVESVAMLQGVQENLAAFGLEPTDELADYTAAVLDAVRAFPDGSIIMVDLYGGTPCNQMMLAALKEGLDLHIISGFGLPMVVDACSLRSAELKGDELLTQIEEIAKAGIINVSDMIHGRNA